MSRYVYKMVLIIQWNPFNLTSSEAVHNLCSQTGCNTKLVILGSYLMMDPVQSYKRNQSFSPHD